ncbi:MAG TPA: sulfatase-like hydrolase/transferase [Terriglobia bacterium]|nr:sulfatase-like hydrolase/transferase [Terriglobia bacterium]
MRLTRRLPSLRIIHLAILLAWTPDALLAGQPPVPEGTDERAPVILISVDTLRADHLSCYGYTRLKTPQIDSLAQGGTLFTQISSQAPITLPSHVSLFTSTYPFANGIRENAQVLPPGAVTLATVLAAQGYNTAAFIGGYFLERRFGLAQGFQTYDSPFDTRVIKGALDLKRPASLVLDGAEHWLQQNSGGSFFLFIHLFDLHQPYDAPASYRARAPQSEYDQELAYVDDSLGSFFEFLKKSGLDRRALVVLLSDHGESLGDHGESTHGYFIYRSTLHVPLIFHWPQATGDRNSKLETGKSARASSFEFPISSFSDFLGRVEGPAGLADVAPTVLSFLGFQSPQSFCGHSLLELAKGGNSPPRDVYSESSYAHDKFGWAILRSLRRGDYQYIDAPHPELYNLKNDAAELHNLLPGQTGLAASYRERLAALMETYRSAPSRASPPAAAAVPGSTENLRSLGYLEITAPQAALDNSGIDPKNRLFEYKRYLLAGHLARTGQAQEAAAEFQAILADDPRNLPAYIELARSDVGLHRYLDGASKLQAALALDPHNLEAEELLGDIWLTVGNFGRAAAEFHQLLTFAPGDYEAHFGLGLVAVHQGKTAEAAEYFTAALGANPHSAEAHYQLGLILEAQNRKEEALREFNAALQIDPKYKDASRELVKLTSPTN